MTTSQLDIEAHVAAFLALVRGSALLAEVTFDGTVDERPQFYCSVFANSGRRQAERLTGPQSRADFSFFVHSVGETPEQVRLVQQHVHQQVIGSVPAIEGRTARPIRHTSAQQIQKDTDLAPPLWFGVDVFELTTSPA